MCQVKNCAAVLPECLCLCVMASLQAGLGPLRGPSIQVTPISQACWVQRPLGAPSSLYLCSRWASEHGEGICQWVCITPTYLSQLGCTV